MKSFKFEDGFSLSSDIIKLIPELISEPIAFLINMCFKKEFFPDELKLYLVSHIFKTFDSNFRTISIKPLIAKIFETVFKTRIIYFLERNDVTSFSIIKAPFNFCLKVLEVFEDDESFLLLIKWKHNGIRTKMLNLYIFSRLFILMIQAVF